MCASARSERSSSAQPCPGKKMKFLLKTPKLLKISPPCLRSQVSHVAKSRVRVPWCWLPPSLAGTHRSFLPLIQGENDPKRKPHARSLCVVCDPIRMPSLFLHFDDASVCSVYKSLYLKRKLRVQTLGVPALV